MKISSRFFSFIPIFVLVIIPAIMILIAPFSALLLGPWRWSGVLLIALGGAVLISTRRAIYQPSQWDGSSYTLPGAGEPNQLVTNGPYRFVRHPMVASVVLVLIGETLLTQSLMLALWTAFIMVIGIPIMVYVEEPRLEKKFGDAYRKYKKAVPRFIPKLF